MEFIHSESESDMCSLCSEYSQLTYCDPIDIDLINLGEPSSNVIQQYRTLVDSNQQISTIDQIQSKIEKVIDQKLENLAQATSESERLQNLKLLSQVISLGIQHSSLGQIVERSRIYEVYTEFLSIEEEEFTYYALSGLQLLTVILCKPSLKSYAEIIPLALFKIMSLMEEGYLSSPGTATNRKLLDRYIHCFKTLLKVIAFDVCREFTKEELLQINAFVIKITKTRKIGISPDNINEILFAFYHYATRSDGRILAFIEKETLFGILKVLEPFTHHFYGFLLAIYHTEEPDFSCIKHFLSTFERDLSNENRAGKAEVVSCIVNWVLISKDRKEVILAILSHAPLVRALFHFHRRDSPVVRMYLFNVLEKTIQVAFSLPQNSKVLETLEELNIGEALVKSMESRNRKIARIAAGLIFRLVLRDISWVHNNNFYQTLLSQLFLLQEREELLKKANKLIFRFERRGGICKTNCIFKDFDLTSEDYQPLEEN